MARINRSLAVVGLCGTLCLNAAGPIRAQTGSLLPLAAIGQQDRAASPQELEDLVAPVALYPDPLLAQILPAATFPDQIQDAARASDGRDPSFLDRQPWDTSVRSVAHYPSVLRLMADRIDWTTDLGQAYVDQPDEVMDAIQRLRADALASGTLVTNSYEEVVREGDRIRIWPARGDVIYVPEYDPSLVYRRGSNPGERIADTLIAFGAGLVIGSWLNNDIDWQHRHVYNHGWEGGGWVGRSRSRITRNDAYFRPEWKNRPAPVNHDVINRRFDRAKVQRYGLADRPAPAARPDTVNRPPVPQNNPDRYRGRENPNLRLPQQPAPIGNYQTPEEVRQARDRGQRSLQGVRAPSSSPPRQGTASPRPAPPAPAPAPVARPQPARQTPPPAPAQTPANPPTRGPGRGGSGPDNGKGNGGGRPNTRKG